MADAMKDLEVEEYDDEEMDELSSDEEQQQANNGAMDRDVDEDEEERGGSSPTSSIAFPISRVRRLIKSENDIAMVGMEAIFVIAKAAELFLEQLAEDALENMCEDNRAQLAYKDLSSTVVSTERLEFLADFVPEKVPASRALAEAPFQIS